MRTSYRCFYKNVKVMLAKGIILRCWLNIVSGMITGLWLYKQQNLLWHLPQTSLAGSFNHTCVLSTLHTYAQNMVPDK